MKGFEDYMLKEHDMMLVRVPGQGNCQFIAALVPIPLWARQAICSSPLMNSSFSLCLTYTLSVLGSPLKNPLILAVLNELFLQLLENGKTNGKTATGSDLLGARAISGFFSSRGDSFKTVGMSDAKLLLPS
eukprot:6209737-Pleurochrysis_carterae.AAC.1